MLFNFRECEFLCIVVEPMDSIANLFHYLYKVGQDLCMAWIVECC